MKFFRQLLVLSSMIIQLNAAGGGPVIGFQTPPPQIQYRNAIPTPRAPECFYGTFLKDVRNYGFYNLFSNDFQGPYYNRAAMITLSLESKKTDIALAIFELQSDWDTNDIFDFFKAALYAKDEVFLKTLETRFATKASPNKDNQIKPVSFYLTHYIYYCLATQNTTAALETLQFFNDPNLSLNLNNHNIAKILNQAVSINALDIIAYIGQTYGNIFEVCIENSKVIYLWTSYKKNENTYEKIIYLNPEQFKAFAPDLRTIKEFEIEKTA